MYKMVIIDDEPLIRDGLKSMVERLCEEWTVAGMAENAERGLDLIRKQQPDLAIVDVRMEGMSGLQMIEQANREQLPTEFIILSGYSEFQLVQQALRLRVYDYLLKPVNRSELVQLLKDMEAKHQKGLSDKGKNNLKKFSLESKTYLLEQTIHQLINGNPNVGRRGREILQHFQIDFDRQYFVFYRMEIRFDLLKKRIKSPRDKELFLLFCKQVIEEHIQKSGIQGYLFLGPDSVPVVLLLGSSKRDLLSKPVFKMIENIRLAVQNYGRIDLMIGSSWVLTGLSNVQVAFGQVLESAKTGWMADPVKQAMEFINRNYAEKMNLRTLADKVHLNPNYLSELFHKKTGTRLVEYINFIRMEEAARLLRETKLPCQEIMERVGYHNYRQFNRVFYHHFLTTPTEYRKKYWD